LKIASNLHGSTQKFVTVEKKNKVQARQTTMIGGVITSLLAVQGRHGSTTESLRSMMEYLVAVSGQMASKSPLEINVFHLVTSLEVWIFFMPIQKCDSSMYLYSHTGSPCPRSHFMVGREAPVMAAEERDDALPVTAMEVVIRSPEIQDAEPIRSAPMPGAATSSRGGIELLADDLVDPATVARHLKAMQQAEQWMKVSDLYP
jgi:hypothetical protein